MRPDRRQLVGLETDGPPLPTGAHVLGADGPRRSVGFVTSSYHSPTLGRPIALAMIDAGQDRIGQEVTVFHLGQTYSARTTAACAFDPKGERRNG